MIDKLQYYAIVGFTGIIGICDYDNIGSVLIEDGSHCCFIKVTNDEAKSYSYGDEEWHSPSSAKYQEVIARVRYRAEFKMCLIEDGG